MTPKEKAQHLIKDFNVQIFTPENGWQTDEEHTKELSIACCNEIISVFKIDYMNVSNKMQTISFWKDVINEINNYYSIDSW